MNISIGIVTFRERKHLVEGLIKQIRQYVPDNIDILLAINGNNEELMPESYRQEMLDLSKQYKNIYPIFCPEFKSLSKLWNTLVIFSKTKYNFIICDDTLFNNPDTLPLVNKHIDSTKDEFFLINNQFSHFVITKDILHTLGYFDERLIGHGEEDGDMVHRYIKIHNKNIPNLHIQNFGNLASYDLKNQNMECHIHNKPTVNRKIAELKNQHDPKGKCGMNPTPLSPTGLLENYQQYPYEMFFINNKHNIAKHTQIQLDDGTYIK